VASAEAAKKTMAVGIGEVAAWLAKSMKAKTMAASIWRRRRRGGAQRGVMKALAVMKRRDAKAKLKAGSGAGRRRKWRRRRRQALAGAEEIANNGKRS